MVCCTYPVGFNLWGIWFGKYEMCNNGCSSIFKSRSGFQYFPHAYQSSFGTQILWLDNKTIVPIHIFSQGEGTPEYKGNVHLFTYPFNDCSLSVPHCTGILVEEHWIRECRGQGVVLTHCLTTVHLNQPGVWCLLLNIGHG